MVTSRSKVTTIIRSLLFLTLFFASSCSNAKTYVEDHNIVGNAQVKGRFSILSGNEARFYDDDDSDYVSLSAPTAVTASYTLTLPTTGGANLECLKTNGSGELSFGDCASVFASEISSTTTATTSVSTYYVDASGGAVELDLPSGSTAGAHRFVVIKTDNSTNAVTLDPDGSEGIVGQSTFDLIGENESVEITSDADSWFLISHKNPGALLELLTCTGTASTATRIVYFSTVQTNLGNAFSYSNDSTNGDSITINRSGVYAVSAGYQNSNADREWGLTVNQSTLTNNITANSTSEVLVTGTTHASRRVSVHTTRYFDKNDVIRFNTDINTGISTTAGDCFLRIQEL